METKIKNNQMMIIWSVMLVILFVVCSLLAPAQTQKTTVNVNFGFGPNYTINKKSFGYSSEVNAEFRKNVVGIEIGVGTQKNIQKDGYRSLLQTCDYAKIGPTFTKKVGITELTTNPYLGYINSSEEGSESLEIKRFAYGGISQKIQITFMTFDEGTLSLGFFAKFGVERIETNNLITSMFGFAFKATPKKR